MWGGVGGVLVWVCVFCFCFLICPLSDGQKKCENNQLYPIRLEQMHSLCYIFYHVYQKWTKLFLRRKVSKLLDTYTCHFTYYNFISSETRTNKNNLIVKHYFALMQQLCVKQQPNVYAFKKFIDRTWICLIFYTQSRLAVFCWNKRQRF